MHTSTPVAIIGGGITGLSTAWYLQQAGIDYTLLEQSNRLGGKVQSDHIDHPAGNFLVERAADAFLAVQKPWAVDLAREIGLEDELLPANEERRRVFVLKDGEPVLLPKGLNLIVPGDMETFLDSPLISEAGKKRVQKEISIPPRLEEGDESVSAFVRRRMGDEVLTRLADPLICGIYNAHPDEQSMLATFPRFVQMEKKYGSLTKGMAVATEEAAKRVKANPGKRFVFTSFKGGTEVLTKTLAIHLQASSQGQISLNTAVQRMTHHQKGYQLHLASGEIISAKHVVMTAPPPATATIVQEMLPAISTQLATFRAVSTGTITFAFRRDEIDHPLDGFGMVIPRVEQRPINSMTWASSKFNLRAPDGYALLRVFFGGTRNPEIMSQPDEMIRATARTELRKLMGIDATPIFDRVNRWMNAQPQYDVGHVERVNTMRAGLPDNLYLAGGFYGGVGIPDCVRQGKDAANMIMGSE
ncbi:MAG: protoporphyrinogen oxidase [Chloroflexota bacterium]